MPLAALRCQQFYVPTAMAGFRIGSDMSNIFQGTWAVPMTSSPCQAPGTCCFSFWLPSCIAYKQRNTILDITGEPYACCAGHCGCCPGPCSSRNPWMCLEACCCTSTAIVSNRFYIQTRFGIANDPCDDKLIAITACINLLAACAECCMGKNSAETLHHLVHFINAVVCSCMLTQQELELTRLKESGGQDFYRGMPEYIYAVMPPQQQSMVQAAKVPVPGMMAQPLTQPLVAQGKEVMQ